MEENRNQPRLQLKNMSVDIFDGVGFFSGTIKDISRYGLCMKQVPSSLEDGMRRLTIVVSGMDKNFRMIVRPRWFNYDGYTQDIGVRIVESPRAWQQFIDELMREEAYNS